MDADQKLKQARYDSRQTIARDPVGFVQDQLIASGVGVMEATYAATDPRVQDGFAIPAKIGAFEKKNGVNFEDLSIRDQSALLNQIMASGMNAPLLTEQVNNPADNPLNRPIVVSPVAEPTGENKVLKINLPDVMVNAPDIEVLKSKFIHSGANVLNYTNQAIAGLIETVGEDNVTGAVWGMKLAVGGIPKTAMSFVMQKVTDAVRGYASEKLSDAIQDYAFDVKSIDNEGKRQDIKVISDAIANFGVGVVFDGARDIVRNVADSRVVLSAFGAKKPYSNPLNRPPYAKGQVEATYEAAKQKNGKVYDPNTGDELPWDRTKSRAGQWDMGHLPDNEYRKLHKDYMDGKLTKEEFLKIYRDPTKYRPELPSNNRGHKYEGSNGSN
ncbi:HNH/ENDO VII family nuclease [Undibacterium danionis]|uniref:HNH/ENDO VII family nuclease n=1 Tax=Undibacterium danionis TaxID=1812100 RepID=A0ABV6IE73_9BURK